jgi:hypothetical protein
LERISNKLDNFDQKFEQKIDDLKFQRGNGPPSLNIG